MNIPDLFDFQKDDRLDGMTVISPIVQGGHGDLYLVSGEKGQKLVLKIIQKTDDEGEFTGIEKCRAILSHIPGLVPILKVGRLPDERVYCVMPPADNLAQWPCYEPDTLAGRISRHGRLQPEDVLKTADKILATVKTLHEAGLAHCDIKPENIVFINGEPMLTDYSLFSDTLIPPVDAPFGTMGFVPSEMIGNPDAFKPGACDLYAIGKVVYCAWSGMDAMLFPSVPQEIPLPEIGVMLPIYMKACSDYPNRRFASADEFISVVANARALLHSRFLVRGPSFFRRYAWLPFFLVPLVLLFMSWRGFFHRSAPTTSAPLPATTSGVIVISDPLSVTTSGDIVDDNDGRTSLREAVAYAKSLAGNQTITFNMSDGDNVTISDPALISQKILFSSKNKANGNPVTITLDNLVIPRRNIGGRGGSILYMEKGNLIVLGGDYSNSNDSSCLWGGAFWVRKGKLTIDGAVIKNNYASRTAGGINAERTQLTIRNTHFEGNSTNGFGGAVDLYANSTPALIADTDFVNNSTGTNSFFHWSGGAIRVMRSSLIYEVTKGTNITNVGNDSGYGGFIALIIMDDDVPGDTASAEFRVDGTLDIGNGNGKDSFSSFIDRSGDFNIFIRKTGRGP